MPARSERSPRSAARAAKDASVASDEHFDGDFAESIAERERAVVSAKPAKADEAAPGSRSEPVRTTMQGGAVTSSRNEPVRNGKVFDTTGVYVSRFRISRGNANSFFSID